MGSAVFLQLHLNRLPNIMRYDRFMHSGIGLATPITDESSSLLDPCYAWQLSVRVCPEFVGKDVKAL